MSLKNDPRLAKVLELLKFRSDVNGIPLFAGDTVMIVSGNHIGKYAKIVGCAVKEGAGELSGFVVMEDNVERELWYYRLNVELPVSQVLVRLRQLTIIVEEFPYFINSIIKRSRASVELLGGTFPVLGDTPVDSVPLRKFIAQLKIANGSE